MDPKAYLTKQDETGRTLMEMLAIFAIMTMFAIFGIMFFRDAVDEHEADRVYEEIVVTASGALNRGTTRTSAGFGDTGWGATATRMGKGFALKEGCPMNALTIKVDGVNQGTCEYLMKRKWPKGMTPLAFYRSDRFDRLCEVSDSLSGGYYMNSETDCTKSGAPDKGAFAVVFTKPQHSATGDFGGWVVSGSNGPEKAPVPVNCETDADCNTGNDCLICNPDTHMCDAGCKRLAYLESDGGKWIDTETPGGSDNLEFRLKLHLLSFTKYGGFFSNWVDEQHNCWRVIQGTADGGGVYISFNTRASGSKYMNIAKNQIHVLTLNKTEFVVDGTSYAASGSNGTANDANIFLFRQSAAATSKMRLYYFQIYDTGNLVRDFIPVHAPFKTDGKQNCMFDRVSKRLFCNAQTGDFIGVEE